MIDELEGKVLVGYGLGTYYNAMKEKLPFRLQYLSDRNYGAMESTYGGLSVISPSQMKEIDNVFAIVFSLEPHIYNSISQDLEELGIPYAPAQKYIGSEIIITGKDLTEKYPKGYRDNWGNEIIYDRTVVLGELRVRFRGEHNRLVIGKNVMLRGLTVSCENNASCSIGEGSEIMEAKIQITNGQVKIGENCLFAYRVWIMNHDHHHIFDKVSGKRINYSKDITIGNHVWICEGASLLAGFAIGDNSIIGAMSVSTSKFGRNVIIAGNPARVIREGVVWARDPTVYFQWDEFEQCYNKKAELYE